MPTSLLTAKVNPRRAAPKPRRSVSRDLWRHNWPRVADLDDGVITFDPCRYTWLRDGITVVREYSVDVPMVEAYATEFNQAWTNLIDDAVDATDGDGLCASITSVLLRPSVITMRCIDVRSTWE